MATTAQDTPETRRGMPAIMVAQTRAAEEHLRKVVGRVRPIYRAMLRSAKAAEVAEEEAQRLSRQAERWSARQRAVEAARWAQEEYAAWSQVTGEYYAALDAAHAQGVAVGPWADLS